MSSLTQAIPGSMAEILARVKISEVYYALTGKQPRRVGSDAWRGAAVWRGGDGLNVSLNDTLNVWHDFTANEGGGVLDLVVRIRGCSRQDALRWLADFTGILLDKQQPLSHTAGRLGEAAAADQAGIAEGATLAESGRGLGRPGARHPQGRLDRFEAATPRYRRDRILDKSDCFLAPDGGCRTRR